ncbi:MAG: hypothetical protein MUC48_04795 [Leptolyngbya sp. Prado105]|jgi:hypothetical protein|nr:hypothetical protein [Leptolyngbya sp. Prado105]
MIEKLKSNQLLAGFAMLLTIGFFTQAMGLPSFGSKEAALECQGTVRQNATISQDNLAKLIQVKTGDSKDTIRKLLKDPYCALPKISIRAGMQTEREAYRLASDALEKSISQTYIVVSYEGDQYLGYKFWIR